MFGKPKIVFVSLTSCEGCQFALLDLGEKFFKVLKKVKLLDFDLIEDKPLKNKNIDVAFVEGNPITTEDVEKLKYLREKAKILVALGNCGALGGIPEMKNYQGKEKTIRHLYKNKGVANPDIKEIDNFVKVDFTIPGCPISGGEFLELVPTLLKGKIPEIKQGQVCSECAFRGKPECFLVSKKVCFGPVTIAGCKAVCPKNGRQCLACRGFLKTSDPKKFAQGLEKFSSKEEVMESLEVFGLRDTIEENNN
jgi:sulfhydrogenase subunit delta